MSQTFSTPQKFNVFQFCWYCQVLVSYSNHQALLLIWILFFFLFSRWPSHFIPVQKIIILMKDIVKINSFYMITHRSSHWEVLCWIDTPLTNNRKSPDYNFSKVFEKYLRCDFFWEKLHSFSELLCGYFPSIFLNFPESLFEEQPLVAPSIFKTNNHCIMPIIFLMESKSQKRPTLSEKVRYVLENGSY